MADGSVPLVVASAELLEPVRLGPPDLRRLERPRDAAAAPGALDSGEIVVRRHRLGRGERELRVAHHFVSRDRDERRLGPVAGALHVVDEPVLERLHLFVLPAGDVG